MLKKCEIAGKSHAASFCGSMLVGGIGLMVAGPFGMFVGSAVGGIVCGVGTRWYCNREDITEYDKTIEAAAKTFGYGNVGASDLLKDEKNFNLQVLKRRYHMKSFFNHPDYLRKIDNMKEDDIQKRWCEFSSKYIILLDLLKERDNKKKDN